MSIIEERIYAADGFTNNEVIMYAFLCSNADKNDDPIDRAIVAAFVKSAASSDGFVQTEIIGFNPSVKRVVAFVKDPSGKAITIAKGLPAKIINMEAGSLDDHARLMTKHAATKLPLLMQASTKVGTRQLQSASVRVMLEK